MCVGTTTQAAGARTPVISNFTKAHAEYIKRLWYWLRIILGFPTGKSISSLQINVDATLKKHKDSNNKGPSWFAAFGEFAGGSLWHTDPSG